MKGTGDDANFVPLAKHARQFIDMPPGCTINAFIRRLP